MEKASLLILPRRKDQRRAKLVRKYLQKLLKIRGLAVPYLDNWSVNTTF
jgi:hypothetical protein